MKPYFAPVGKLKAGKGVRTKRQARARRDRIEKERRLQQALAAERDR